MSSPCMWQTQNVKYHVLSIVDTLENPPLLDGVDKYYMGYEEEDETYLSAHDYLNDVLEVVYIVDGQKKYLGARLLVSCGGPNIYVDTSQGVVAGLWGVNSYSEQFTDNLGLDDACRDMYVSRPHKESEKWMSKELTIKQGEFLEFIKESKSYTKSWPAWKKECVQAVSRSNKPEQLSRNKKMTELELQSSDSKDTKEEYTIERNGKLWGTYDKRSEALRAWDKGVDYAIGGDKYVMRCGDRVMSQYEPVNRNNDNNEYGGTI